MEHQQKFMKNGDATNEVDSVDTTATNDTTTTTTTATTATTATTTNHPIPMDFGVKFEQVIVDSIKSEQEVESIQSWEDLRHLMSQMTDSDLARVLSTAETIADADVPKIVMITNLDTRIFLEGSPQRMEFERIFLSIDPEAKIIYFRSFCRARIDFTTNIASTKARILCNGELIGNKHVHTYFADIGDITSSCLLQPPNPEKQFLISPPSSPPEGWKPVKEGEPVLNLELQSALANLLPGYSHELHPASADQPGIVVHICGPDDDDYDGDDADNDNDHHHGGTNKVMNHGSKPEMIESSGNNGNDGNDTPVDGKTDDGNGENGANGNNDNEMAAAAAAAAAAAVITTSSSTRPRGKIPQTACPPR